jgi:hypothetical protein
VEKAVRRAMREFRKLVDHDRERFQRELTAVGLSVAAFDMLDDFDPYYGRTFEAYALNALVYEHLLGFIRFERHAFSASQYGHRKLRDSYYAELPEIESNDDPLSCLDNWEERAGNELDAALADDPAAYVIQQIVVHGRAASDLAVELYGEDSKSTRAKIGRLKSDGLKRLRKSEALRDLYAERFGVDECEIDYGHEAAAKQFDQPSTTASTAPGPAGSEGPPFCSDDEEHAIGSCQACPSQNPTTRAAASTPAGVSPEPPGVASHKAASPLWPTPQPSTLPRQHGGTITARRPPWAIWTPPLRASDGGGRALLPSQRADTPRTLRMRHAGWPADPLLPHSGSAKVRLPLPAGTLRLDEQLAAQSMPLASGVRHSVRRRRGSLTALTHNERTIHGEDQRRPRDQDVLRPQGRRSAQGDPISQGGRVLRVVRSGVRSRDGQAAGHRNSGRCLDLRSGTHATRCRLHRSSGETTARPLGGRHGGTLYARVAQQVERRHRKALVAGSIPAAGSIYSPRAGPAPPAAPS